MSVFFDGTGNNKYNTEERLKNTSVYRWTSDTFGESYENDYSNVARLFEWLNTASSPPELHKKFYIEGMGTKAKEGDKIYGMLIGTGDTGIVKRNGELGEGRIREALNEVLDWVQKNVDKDDKTIELLKIDVFGFSRGAAAARAFVYFALNNIEGNFSIKLQLQVLGYRVSDVKVHFTGLFDTVAAFGLMNSNDTADLHLDAIRDSTFVLHLVAKNEYRDGFPLTNINSATGIEIFLPGAHSDIGGGYVNNMQEEDLILMHLPYVKEEAGVGVNYHKKDKFVENIELLTNEKNRLVQEGWYKEEELDISNHYQLKASRLNIRNTYSYIPLQIMKKYSVYFGLRFLSVFDKKYSIPTKEFYLNKLMDCITVNGKGDYTKQHELMKHIRHLYFHSSAHYNKAFMYPRFKDDSKTIKERKVYPG